jgi:hypothetical protein
MDNPACHVIYVNHTVGEERLVRADSTDEDPHDAVRSEVKPLLEAFGDGS